MYVKVCLSNKKLTTRNFSFFEFQMVSSYFFVFLSVLLFRSHKKSYVEVTNQKLKNLLFLIDLMCFNSFTSRFWLVKIFFLTIFWISYFFRWMAFFGLWKFSVQNGVLERLGPHRRMRILRIEIYLKKNSLFNNTPGSLDKSSG